MLTYSLFENVLILNVVCFICAFFLWNCLSNFKFISTAKNSPSLRAERSNLMSFSFILSTASPPLIETVSVVNLVVSLMSHFPTKTQRTQHFLSDLYALCGKYLFFFVSLRFIRQKIIIFFSSEDEYSRTARPLQSGCTVVTVRLHDHYSPTV